MLTNNSYNSNKKYKLNFLYNNKILIKITIWKILKKVKKTVNFISTIKKTFQHKILFKKTHLANKANNKFIWNNNNNNNNNFLNRIIMLILQIMEFKYLNY